jgi:predicted membrane-bound mannosyltransferase
MTRPALRPLTAATAALVAGAVGVVPSTAAGAPPAPAAAAHWRAPHPQLALIPPKVTPAAMGATTARESGAPQTGLAVGSVVVAGDGIEGTQPGGNGTAGRASGAPARARAPPQ